MKKPEKLLGPFSMPQMYDADEMDLFLESKDARIRELEAALDGIREEVTLEVEQIIICALRGEDEKA